MSDPNRLFKSVVLFGIAAGAAASAHCNHGENEVMIVPVYCPESGYLNSNCQNHGGSPPGAGDGPYDAYAYPLVDADGDGEGSAVSDADARDASPDSAVDGAPDADASAD